MQPKPLVTLGDRGCISFEANLAAQTQLVL